MAPQEARTSMSLEHLPLDLLRLILTDFICPHSLRSLIQASPVFLRVFLDSKQFILSSVIRRAIHPAAAVQALIAVEAATIQPRGPSRQVVLDFFKTTEDASSRLRSTGKIPFSQLNSLYRLYFSSHDLISDLETQLGSIQKWHQYPSDRSTQSNPFVFSWIEVGRLQRALFCLETYGCLFSLSSDRDAEFSASERQRLFFAGKQPWQVEELACVYDFLLNRLGHLLREAEYDYAQIALWADEYSCTRPNELPSYQDKSSEESGPGSSTAGTDHGHHEPVPQTQSLQPMDTSDDRGVEVKDADDDNARSDLLNDWDDIDTSDAEYFEFGWGKAGFDAIEEGIFSMHFKWRHKLYLQHLINLGTPFLSKLFKASSKRRILLFIKNFGDGRHRYYDYFSRVGLEELLAEGRRGTGLMSKSEVDEFVDSAWRPSFGHINHSLLHQDEDILEERNTDWIFIFLDSRRWHEWGLMDSVSIRDELRAVVVSQLQQRDTRSVPDIVAEEWAKYMSKYNRARYGSGRRRNVLLPFENHAR